MSGELADDEVRGEGEYVRVHFRGLAFRMVEQHSQHFVFDARAALPVRTEGVEKVFWVHTKERSSLSKGDHRCLGVVSDIAIHPGEKVTEEGLFADQRNDRASDLFARARSQLRVDGIGHIAAKVSSASALSRRTSTTSGPAFATMSRCSVKRRSLGSVSWVSSETRFEPCSSVGTKSGFVTAR